MTIAWQVFYSYSHKDSDARETLSTYLDPLRRQGKIVEWYDRRIAPGEDWKEAISDRLDSAHLIVFLVSEAFLASDYCFDVEVDRALARLKAGEVKIVPVLIKPCLWKQSRFSQLQFLPHGSVPISSRPSREEAYTNVAEEIGKLVSVPPPSSLHEVKTPSDGAGALIASIDIVRGQVRSYATLYEKIRQRMSASDDRTRRMESVFQKMRALSSAAYPLLDELVNSPSPGERLAAVAILQVFSNASYLPFLVKLVGTEKPFVGYHATKALEFAVGAIDPKDHSLLLAAIQDAQNARKSAGLDKERDRVLRDAELELRTTIDSLAARPARHL